MDQLELDQVLTHTFSKALQSDDQSDGSGQHDSSMLIGIFRKQILLHYREKYRSENAVTKARNSAREVLGRAFDIPTELSGLDSTVLGESDNQSFWDAFNECVDMLDEVHAEVFILRDLEDISVEEVCGIFGLSRKDVLELVYRARMTVIACLAKALEPEH